MRPFAIMEGSAKDSVAMRTGVRIPEWLCLGFFAYATAASFIFSLSLRQRLVLLGLNLVACGVVMLLARFGTEERSSFLAIVRDWIPCVLILVAYRESGLLVTPDPTHHLDYLFIRLDDVLLKDSWVVGLLTATSPWLQRYLEFAYFLCYPSVPLGIGALYLARRISTRDAQERVIAAAAVGTGSEAIGRQCSDSVLIGKSVV